MFERFYRVDSARSRRRPAGSAGRVGAGAGDRRRAGGGARGTVDVVSTPGGRGHLPGVVAPDSGVPGPQQRAGRFQRRSQSERGRWEHERSGTEQGARPDHGAADSPAAAVEEPTPERSASPTGRSGTQRRRRRPSGQRPSHGGGRRRRSYPGPGAAGAGLPRWAPAPDRPLAAPGWGGADPLGRRRGVGRRPGGGTAVAAAAAPLVTAIVMVGLMLLSAVAVGWSGDACTATSPAAPPEGGPPWWWTAPQLEVHLAGQHRLPGQSQCGVDPGGAVRRLRRGAVRRRAHPHQRARGGARERHRGGAVHDGGTRRPPSSGGSAQRHRGDQSGRGVGPGPGHLRRQRQGAGGRHGVGDRQPAGVRGVGDPGDHQRPGPAPSAGGDQRGDPAGLLQTDAAINRGNSGARW